MAMSLQNYYDRIVWLNLTVYFIYIAIRYIPAIVYMVTCKCHSNEKSCDKSCLCFISMIFGKQLDVKEQTAEKENKLCLRKSSRSYSSRCWQIIVLHIAVFESVVLALGSALDLTLFAVTYICTEDPNIDCYPQLIQENDTSINITVDEPIQDCSFWNSDGISERVTFLCFQRTYSFEQFLAYSGGVLALTIIAMRTALGLLLSIKKYFSESTSKWLLGIRIFSIVIAEVILAVLLAVHLVLGTTRISADNHTDTPEVMFLTSNLTDILILCGTITTLLWLPWEKYYVTQNNSNARQDVELKEP